MGKLRSGGRYCIDEGAAGLWEVDPVERLSFFQAASRNVFEGKLVLKQLHLHCLMLPVSVRCQGNCRE